MEATLKLKHSINKPTAPRRKIKKQNLLGKIFYANELLKEDINKISLQDFYDLALKLAKN